MQISNLILIFAITLFIAAIHECRDSNSKPNALAPIAREKRRIKFRLPSLRRPPQNIPQRPLQIQAAKIYKNYALQIYGLTILSHVGAIGIYIGFDQWRKSQKSAYEKYTERYIHDSKQVNSVGFEEKIKVNQVVKILGIAADNFDLNFITDNADIAFHMNIRFNERVVVRNSNRGGWSHNEWPNEERHGGFPFEKSKPFEISIKFKENMFKVSVDHENFFDYTYRMPMDQISLFALHGDVTAELGMV